MTGEMWKTFSVDSSCPHRVNNTDCEMDNFRQVAEHICKRCRGDFLVHLGSQVELLNWTVVLDELHGAIAADIPVHAWWAGAVHSICLDVEDLFYWLPH